MFSMRPRAVNKLTGAPMKSRPMTASMTLLGTVALVPQYELRHGLARGRAQLRNDGQLGALHLNVIYLSLVLDALDGGLPMPPRTFNHTRFTVSSAGFTIVRVV